MFQATETYEIIDVPKDTLDFYDSELRELIQQTEMEIGNYVPQDSEETIDFLQERKIKPLIDPIAIKVSEYLKDVCGSNVDVDVIKQKYESSTNGISILIALRRILPEWQTYFNYRGKCKVYFIESWINESRQGGIFLFGNAKKNFVQIQAITKYIASALIGVLYPECNLHKLNDGLNSAIMTSTRAIGAKTIFVKPIENQGDILKEYYGYKMLINGHPTVQSENFPYYPNYQNRFYVCDIIMRARGTWYYKKIPDETVE
jgi:hypothetical protein